MQDFRPDVDPSLCSKQRQLKRAKLADSLANQLSHRPGPLELIQKNILHTDDPVEQLVKQGSIPFTPTAQGVAAPSCKPLGETSSDVIYGAADDDSSDTAPSPSAAAGTVPYHLGTVLLVCFGQCCGAESGRGRNGFA